MPQCPPECAALRHIFADQEQAAELAHNRFHQLVDYYEGEGRPQYYALALVESVSEGMLYGGLIAARAKGILPLHRALQDPKVATSFRMYQRSVREAIAQLQRHTESVRYEIQSVNAFIHWYVTTIRNVIHEYVPAEKLGEFHERLSQLVEGGPLPLPPGAGPEGLREEH